MTKKKTTRETLEDAIQRMSLDGRTGRPTNMVYHELPVDDHGKAIVVPFSDLHLGSPQFNKGLFEDNLDWTWRTPNAVILLNGDLIEAATRNSVGAGVYEQVMPINEQLDMVLGYFMPFAEQGRILATTEGNHEERTYKESGVDVARLIAQQLRVPYFRHGGHFLWKVGKQNYRAYFTHGASGARLPHTKIKALIDIAGFVDADLYGMGHVHELQHHAREFQRINTRNKTVEKTERHFVLTGHYLNWETGYAQMKSMIPSKQGTPKIKLHSPERMIKVSM